MADQAVGEIITSDVLDWARDLAEIQRVFAGSRPDPERSKSAPSGAVILAPRARQIPAGFVPGQFAISA